jgi:hypothetical protein
MEGELTHCLIDNRCGRSYGVSRLPGQPQVAVSNGPSDHSICFCSARSSSRDDEQRWQLVGVHLAVDLCRTEHSCDSNRGNAVDPVAVLPVSTSTCPLWQQSRRQTLSSPCVVKRILHDVADDPFDPGLVAARDYGIHDLNVDCPTAARDQGTSPSIRRTIGIRSTPLFALRSWTAKADVLLQASNLRASSRASWSTPEPRSQPPGDSPS